jgi:hypothetical protein
VKRFLLLSLCLLFVVPNVFAQRKEVAKSERVEVDKKGDKYLVTTTTTTRETKVKLAESALTGKTVKASAETYIFKPKPDITVEELVEILRALLEEANSDRLSRESIDALSPKLKRHFSDPPEVEKVETAEGEECDEGEGDCEKDAEP